MLDTWKKKPHVKSYTHTHTHTYVYMYMYAYRCVCVYLSNTQEMQILHVCIWFFPVSSPGLEGVPNTCNYLNKMVLAFLGVIEIFTQRS